jgi:hypothetical protein
MRSRALADLGESGSADCVFESKQTRVFRQKSWGFLGKKSGGVFPAFFQVPAILQILFGFFGSIVTLYYVTVHIFFSESIITLYIVTIYN